MARQAHDREDLLREAVALVPRVLLKMLVGARPCEVFAGFRGDSLSLYFDGDPVYHFNAKGQLRRAFVNDRIVKAQQSELWSMTPIRGDDLVAMQSHVLSDADQSELMAFLGERLQSVRDRLATGQFELLGQVPDEVDVVVDLKHWLDHHREIIVADSPGVNR